MVQQREMTSPSSVLSPSHFSSNSTVEEELARQQALEVQTHSLSEHLQQALEVQTHSLSEHLHANFMPNFKSNCNSHKFEFSSRKVLGRLFLCDMLNFKAIVRKLCLNLAWFLHI